MPHLFHHSNTLYSSHDATVVCLVLVIISLALDISSCVCCVCVYISTLRAFRGLERLAGGGTLLTSMLGSVNARTAVVVVAVVVAVSAGGGGIGVVTAAGVVAVAVAEGMTKSLESLGALR